MTADRLDGIGHDALPRIGSVATGHADVVHTAALSGVASTNPGPNRNLRY
jgi:hypothetical protein